MKLPRLDWLALDDSQRLLEALDAGSGATRLVGGCVRDSLLGLPATDIDLATRLLPAEVMARLQYASITALPTSITHGTITSRTSSSSVEITTLRRDVSTDGRHAEVAFTGDWQADAARRDFTVNALYADPISLEISDFFGGVDDLHQRRIRFIGEPLARIAEDHLRILRFFRFYARFGADAPDAEGLSACTARANDLMALSRERIRDELSKLLGVADPAATVAIMIDAGIFTPVLPEITAAAMPPLAALVAAEAAARLAPLWLRRLAAMLPRAADVLEAMATRLRLSNAERKRLTAMAGQGVTRVDAYRDGKDAVIDRLLLAGAVAAEVAAIQAWDVPDLPASGRDLIARGVVAGPEVRLRLARFEAAWIAAGFPAEPTAVAALLDTAVG